MSLRLSVLAAGILAFTFPAQADGVNSPIRVKWDGLSIVVGKTVSIAMPDATVITGTARSVQSDALEVQVTKTSNPAAWPKGLHRVPRATLRIVEMRTKTVHYRVISTTVGVLAGTAAGVATGLAITGGILSDRNTNQAAATVLGLMAAGTVGGYLIGNVADRRSTIIEVLPD